MVTALDASSSLISMARTPSKKTRPKYPSPFDPEFGEYGAGAPPLTLLEMKLCALGSEIRQKPRWWEKVVV